MTPEQLTSRQHRQLAFVQQAHPDLSTAYELAGNFVELVTTRQTDGLPRWLEAASQSEIAELNALARGMRRDGAAVQAALWLPWSTGPVEGQIIRVKMLKRTMFGRSGYPLLRQRVLVHL
jgi:transposase